MILPCRLRRLRSTSQLRDTVAETTLSPANLIQPLFVIDGVNERETISQMPGVDRLTTDLLVTKAKSLIAGGINTVALFPSIKDELKDERGSYALSQDNLLLKAVKELKNKVPELLIMVDVALDPYTSHGHDGILQGCEIDNDGTVSILIEQALLLAAAGADMLAPSDMMDGRIGAIRQALERERFINTKIISYAAKYASNFYGPYRHAVGSFTKLKTDKRTYQMDIRNSTEALREVALDIEEGADIVMIKPAGLYLDIIKNISQTFPIPVFAYQVSGEYAMLKNAGLNNILDYRHAMIESLIAIKRSGARAIITYAAEEIASTL